MRRPWLPLCRNAAAPAKAMAKVSPRARPSDKLHIHIIQYAVRAIFQRLIRKASVREILPTRDRHYAGRDFQGGESRPVAFRAYLIVILSVAKDLGWSLI